LATAWPLPLLRCRLFERVTGRRRAWCQRRGQAQRWWHNQNVALLPFTSDALAASV